MITIKYTWTKELAIKSAKDLYDYEINNSNKKYIGWFFVALTQFAVVGALKHDAYGLLFIATFLVFYWYVLRWPIREYFIKRTFDKSPFANKSIELIAKKDGIYKDDKLQISSNDIKKTVELDDGILIYYTGVNIYFPKNGFTNTKDRKAVLNLYSN